MKLKRRVTITEETTTTVVNVIREYRTIEARDDAGLEVIVLKTRPIDKRATKPIKRTHLIQEKK